MTSIDWELGKDIYVSALVNPALPIRMTYRFFPKERISDSTAEGRIGDQNTENDIIVVPNDPALEVDEAPYLTFVAQLVPGRSTQNSFEFSLIFFDQSNKDSYDLGTPLEELELLSIIPFKDSFASRFVILDERLGIAFFEWQ